MNARADLETFLARETGLAVARGGVQRSIDRFLERRRRTLGLTSVEAYVRSLVSDRGDEMNRLVEAVTVPHSWFYRDAEQWALIEDWMRAWVGRQPAIWVPACATGEDVYTMAFVARHQGIHARIVGSDINGAALTAARAGRYGAWSLRELPAHLRDRGVTECAAGSFEVRPEPKAMVSLVHHNLMHLPPAAPKGTGWDLILCRNVLFYFASETAEAVVHRLANALAPGGRLLLGASDMLHAPPRDFRVMRVADRIVVEREETKHRRPARTRAPTRPSVRTLARPRARPAGSSRPVAATAPVDASTLSAVDVDPLDPLARLRAGMQLHAAGDFAAAAADLRAALFLAPDLWPAALYLGLCHAQSGHMEDARREIARAAAAADQASALDALPGELHPFADELRLLARQKLRRMIA